MAQKDTFKNSLKSLQKLLQENDKLAQEMYAALCNTNWEQISGTEKYSCSWRYAGGLVAGLREKKESYMDFYCSGGEGKVTPRISSLMSKLGWRHYIMRRSRDEEPSIKTPPNFKFNNEISWWDELPTQKVRLKTL